MQKKQNDTEKEVNTQKLLDDEKKKSEMYLGQYKYLKADFENYKRINDRERSTTIQNANQKLIEKMLPIIDDIENAIEKSKNKEHKKGLEMILNNFMKLLGEDGLEPIKCIGTKFDPHYHEVLIKEESDKDDEIITREIQKGYTLNKKVIRHSKVKVSKKR